MIGCMPKALNNGFKWAARDLNGELFLYTSKPYKDETNEVWLCVKGINSLRAFKGLFNFIKWEDGKPISIKSILEYSYLTPQEHEYLFNLIKPFRSQVDYIEKCGSYTESICLHTINDEYVSLPSFPSGMFFKGLERFKEYKLEELGL